MSLAIDANFRLKLKERGVTDPELGPGWAYFVNDKKYKAEIIKHPQPIEVSRNFHSSLSVLTFHDRKAIAPLLIKRLSGRRPR